MPSPRSRRVARLITFICFRWNAIKAGKPTPEVDVSAAAAAERVELQCRRPPADRARGIGCFPFRHACTPASIPPPKMTDQDA